MSIESIKDYYGKRLASSADLKTDACCDPGEVPPRIRAALADIHEDLPR
jgi:hypothetical protein